MNYNRLLIFAQICLGAAVSWYISGVFFDFEYLFGLSANFIHAIVAIILTVSLIIVVIFTDGAYFVRILLALIYVLFTVAIVWAALHFA